ncbi:ribonuclease H-like domain-containing protein, partial [Tanacetum coccineum]
MSSDLAHQPTPTLIQQASTTPFSLWSKAGMFLSQEKYAHMLNCNPCHTLVDTDYKLGVDGDLVEDPTLYRRLAASLRYVRGTMGYGLQLYSASTYSLVAYSDEDWAGCPTAMQSTYG